MLSIAEGTLTDLPPGAYTLEVHHLGTVHRRPIEVSSEAEASETIRLEKPQ